MIQVHFVKHFVTGNLKGLKYPSQSSFNNMYNAIEFVNYLNAHTTKVIDSFDSSNYIISDISIDNKTGH